ncbi:MAG: hypothetical protein JW955_22680 [Sedimentisphaerales bacterium]|nr:hypothetical protein [Sedimentisphaerales bacterium]
MEENSVRLRASTLWVPGVLVVVLSVLIQARAARLHKYVRFVAANAVACELPVDLSIPTSQETTLVPAVRRRFTVHLVLRTADPNHADQDPSLADPFPENAVGEALKAGTFEVVWRLSEGENERFAGSVTEKDLAVKFHGADIRYVFGDWQVPLKAGRSYKLVVEVVGPFAALNDFAPTLAIRTSASLKGHLLAGWRLRDTALLLVLGSSLIFLGLSKRYSDRKKRRRLPATASA